MQRIHWKRIAQLGLLGLVVLTFLGADSDARFQYLGHQMMCMCSCNQILLECNHVGCPMSDGMRADLAAYVERGDSNSLVEQAFVQKYGPTVLLAPTTTGFNRVAWIMPFAALILGLTAVVIVVRAWKKRPDPALADGIPHAQNRDVERFSEQIRKETDL